MNEKKEFGDFQTPLSLAVRVVSIVDKLFKSPDFVVEPTAGIGAFLQAAANQWSSIATYEGYEINKEYVDTACRRLANFGIRVYHRDFFTEDWIANLSKSNGQKVLVIGNPPWVTNSALGQLGSSNLPKKTNFQRLRGFDAKTGKSNFDIAEWMLIRLIEALPSTGAIAMLCKTITARKVLRHFWKNDIGRENSSLFHIDAKAEFNVSVDACLFFTTGKKTVERLATVYSDLDLESKKTRFGFIDGDLVSDIDDYQTLKNLDGGSSLYTWRSGIKHDAAKVMEFTCNGNQLVNGFGESIEIEKDYVFPLLKSSDLGNGISAARKSVLVTQRRTSEDTSEIKYRAPKAWNYLMRYSSILDGRKSSIYRNRPRFSVFGIGPYSFAPWKIAISGLYKKISFTLVHPIKDKPVMVDDTCYSIPCQSKEEANLLFALLSSISATKFLNSLIFSDSKRPITIDVLRRLSFVELARGEGKLDKLEEFINAEPLNDETEMQLSLVIEPKSKYQSNKQAVTHNQSLKLL